MNRRQAERRNKLVCSLPRREGGKAKLNDIFHQSLDDKCHRMLNAIEPGTEIPIHRHPDKDESFVVLSQEAGLYGVDIPKGVWHKLESLASGSVVFECKEGPFVTHEVEGILELKK